MMRRTNHRQDDGSSRPQRREQRPARRGRDHEDSEAHLPHGQNVLIGLALAAVVGLGLGYLFAPWKVMVLVTGGVLVLGGFAWALVLALEEGELGKCVYPITCIFTGFRDFGHYSAPCGLSYSGGILITLMVLFYDKFDPPLAPVVVDAKSTPVSSPNSGPPVPAPVPVENPYSQLPPGVLALPPYAVEDIQVTTFNLDARNHIPCLCWTSDARGFFSLDWRTGVVRRVLLAGFREDRRQNLGMVSSWLSRSAEGLLITCKSPPGCLLLDEETLQVKKRYALPEGYRAVSAPSLSLAVFGRGYATRDQASELQVMDLRTDTVVTTLKTEMVPRACPLEYPSLSPDGKHLYTRQGDNTARFRVEGTKLTHEETIGNTGVAWQSPVCFSSDSRLLVIPGSGKKYHARKQQKVPIFDRSSLAAPVVEFITGIDPPAVGLDIQVPAIYASGDGSPLQVFDMAGRLVRSYQLDREGLEKRARQYLVDPAGRRVLVLGDQHLYHVELPRLNRK